MYRGLRSGWWPLWRTHYWHNWICKPGTESLNKQGFNLNLSTKTTSRYKFGKSSNINLYISVFILTDEWEEEGIPAYISVKFAYKSEAIDSFSFEQNYFNNLLILLKVILKISFDLYVLGLIWDTFLHNGIFLTRIKMYLVTNRMMHICSIFKDWYFESIYRRVQSRFLFDTKQIIAATWLKLFRT